MRVNKFIVTLVSVFVILACGGGDGSHDPIDPSPGGGGGGGGVSAPQIYYQSVTISEQGGEQIVTLTDLSSAVSSISSSPYWFIIAKQDYTSGSPTIKLLVEENKTTNERSSEVTILSVSGDKVFLTVTQQAASDDDSYNDIEEPHHESTDQPAYAPEL